MVASGLEPLDPTHMFGSVAGHDTHRRSTAVRVASGLALVSPRQPRQSHPDRGVRPSTGLDKALTGLTDKASTYSDRASATQRFNRNSASRRHTSHRAGAEPAARPVAVRRDRAVGCFDRKLPRLCPGTWAPRRAGAVRRASTLTVTLVPHSSADTPFRRHSDAIPHHRRRR